MKQDSYKTKVEFYKGKDGSVFAFFPKDIYKESDSKLLQFYRHIGQHSACYIDFLKECKKVTKKEYADLKSELESEVI